MLVLGIKSNYLGLKNIIANFVPPKIVIKMSQIPRIYRRFIPQLLHMIVLPIFFFTFMLLYKPFDSITFLGHEWFGVHLTIISCIILLSVILIRLLYYFLPLSLSYSLYILWCMTEVIFTSFFAALYLWLVLDKPMQYFEVLAVSLQYISLSLVIPYIILALSLRIYEYSNSTSAESQAESQRMRFYDEKHNLKIVLDAQSILYVEADVNYVNIYYSENDKIRSYSLRNSMKAIDELCHDHGLVRCQRSFYVNPRHIKVLRKEKDGIVYAELDAKDVRHIPVTKKYYDKLTEMLY